MKLLGIGSRIQHQEYGFGVITNIDNKHYWVTFQNYGVETIEIDSKFEIIEALENDDVDTISFFEVEKMLRFILKKWSDISEIISIADKYRGGTLILKPADEHLAEKEIPIDTFFHKIVMVRDRMRVMEQKINSNKHLSDQDKVDLQQYITRIYGSLTTFNVLFKHKEEQFQGMKAK